MCSKDYSSVDFTIQAAKKTIMPSTQHYEDDEITLEDDEETISVCSSVVSEETLDFVPSRPVRRSLRSGLMRSDGREAVSGQRPSGLPPTEPGHALLMSPRARELKRRRPPQKLPSVTLVSENSLDEMADHAPSCPRRELSRDGDSWPAMDPPKAMSTSGSPRILSSSRERRKTLGHRSDHLCRN